LLFSSNVLFATTKDKIISVVVNGTTFKIYDDSVNEEGAILSYYNSTNKIQTGKLAEDVIAKVGDLKVKFKALTVITFYENGNIKCGGLAEDLTTDLGRFKANNFISFFEAGGIQIGTLAGNTKINGVLYKGLTQIILNSSGKVIEGNLANITKINGIDFSAKKITYYDSGNIHMGWLERNTVINGYEFKGLEIVSFYNSGKLIGSTLTKDVTVGKYKLQKNTFISFYESGNLKWGIPYGEFVESDGIKFLIDSRGVNFYESGKIQAGFLAEDVIINNIKSLLSG